VRACSPVVSSFLAFFPPGQAASDEIIQIPMKYFLDWSQQKATENIYNDKH